MEYCGIDLHAEQSQICILDEDGEVMETSTVRTSRKALERFFRRDRMRVVMEAGGSSPWVSCLLDSLGHEVVVCSPRRVRLIAESKLKNDREGDPEMRRLLVQAAHACLLTKADSELKRWALALAERKGKGKAVVALARKLAVLMHHLWVTGEIYQAFPNNDDVKAA